MPRIQSPRAGWRCSCGWPPDSGSVAAGAAPVDGRVSCVPGVGEDCVAGVLAVVQGSVGGSPVIEGAKGGRGPVLRCGSWTVRVRAGSSGGGCPVAGESAGCPGAGRPGVGAPGPSGRPPPGGGRGPQRTGPGGGLHRSPRRAAGSRRPPLEAPGGSDAAARPDQGPSGPADRPGPAPAPVVCRTPVRRGHVARFRPRPPPSPPPGRAVADDPVCSRRNCAMAQERHV